MREFSSLTYLSNTLFAFDRFMNNKNVTLEENDGEAMEDELSLLMHHDTITGTSYQYVNDDYIN